MSAIPPINLNTEPAEPVIVELSSDIPSIETVELDSSDCGVVPHCNLDVADFATADLSLESQSLSVGMQRRMTANIKLIVGSVGEDGDGIRSITYTYVAEGVRVDILLSSGRSSSFTLLNGPKGDDGPPGRDADIGGCNQAIQEARDFLSTAKAVTDEASHVDAHLSDDAILSVTNRQGEVKRVDVRGPKGDDGNTTVTSLSRYTLAEYLAIKESGKLENIFYSIYKGDTLYRVYLGATLVGKKAEDGEKVTIGAAFPLVFPIIFA